MTERQQILEWLLQMQQRRADGTSTLADAEVFDGHLLDTDKALAAADGELQGLCLLNRPDYS